ncbi:MAG: orotidine-5'-phosphate decarboxylase [Rhodospirillaceae bacterium]|nr:orotidine-5'-phosphate decarboxylase [Rhodospirillaceae bacterium]
MNKTSEIYLGLDTTKIDKAIAMAKNLRHVIGGIKIGKEFFSSNGPKGVKELNTLNIPVFLDLKFHDIPNTVYGAIKSTCKLKPKILNVHTLGGPKMLEAAVQSARENYEEIKPLIIGVTLLTSLDQNDLKLLGYKGNIEETVLNLALLAKKCGLDGVVCSPQEIKLIREKCGKDFMIITPGIRIDKSDKDDQVRTLSPVEAQKEGANILVIGRPITKAPDPLLIAKKIQSSLR